MANLELFIQVMIALIIIIIMAQLFGRLIKLIGQPSVVGEMISGVVLGPTVFGYFLPEASGFIFPKEIMSSLFIISNLGLSIYMFLVGAELNMSLFNKKTFNDATALSTAAIIVPFIMGGIAAWLFNDQINTMGIDKLSMVIFLGTALAITAFPMLARILQEHKIVNSRIGVLSLLSACIQDVVSWILLGLVTVMSTTKEYSGIIVMVAGVALLTFTLFYLVRPALAKVAEKVHAFEDLSSASFGIVVLLLLICALITDELGLYSVFGGFILGLSLPATDFLFKLFPCDLKI